MFREPIKSPKWFMRKVEIKESPVHSRGIFATKMIDRHEMFESCPVILFHQSLLTDFEELHAGTHILQNYVFLWPNGKVAVAMGYGGMYNHSNDDANAQYIIRTDEPRIEFTAKRIIEPGEEIFTHYQRGHGTVGFNDTGDCFGSGKLDPNTAAAYAHLLNKW